MYKYDLEKTPMELIQGTSHYIFLNKISCITVVSFIPFDLQVNSYISRELEMTMISNNLDEELKRMESHRLLQIL